MANAIIAVGGTGKRVASLYLKVLNTLRPANVSAPGSSVFVVDMEPESGTTDDRLNNELRIEGVPASHFISPVLEEARVQRTITLSEFMGFEKGGSTLPLAHALFNANQLNVQIIKGMNCEPTVGATVAARRFSINATEQEDEVQNLEDGIAGFERIIVVGSVIGGTGAGVTPQLIDWMRHRAPNKKIYGLLFLRWIDLPQTDEDAPSNVKMYGNAKAWLNYLLEHHNENPYPYRQRRELFTSYVLIGAPHDMELSRADSDSHHPLHLLGAAYLLQFDSYNELATAAEGPHYIELKDGYKPQDLNVGDTSMAAAVVWEKLFNYLLAIFQEQRPDEALSPFTLMLSKRLAWTPFTATMERFAAKWGRRNQLRHDWRKISDAFETERRKSESRVEELQKLTSIMPGADRIFHFDWNDLQRQYENKKPTALSLAQTNLRMVPVPSPEKKKSLPDNILKEIADKFIEQLRVILRKYT